MGAAAKPFDLRKNMTRTDFDHKIHAATFNAGF